MITKTLYSIPFMLCLATGQSFAQYQWSDDVGGNLNIPPKEYNPHFHGYGSTGQVIYNKIDLQDGRTMYIDNAPLYDNQGNYIATAKESGIGYYDGKKDGGLIAGAITKIKIDGKDRQVMYAWSVNVEEGGRTSGWVRTNEFTPKDDIRDIQQSIKEVRKSLLPSDLENRSYKQNTVGRATLPAEAEEWYIVPGRDPSKTQGKAKYYFTRDNLISGLKNIPETGSQRFGVSHDHIPRLSKFYTDRSVDIVELPIYEPNKTKASPYKLRLAWGYSINSSGRKWYSWINADALK